MHIVIAHSSYLLCQGMKLLLSQLEAVKQVVEVKDSTEMHTHLHRLSEAILLIDYRSEGFSVDDVQRVLLAQPSVKVIGITSDVDAEQAGALIKAGIHGHLLADCDRDEIEESLRECASGSRFFCGKVLERVSDSAGQKVRLGCDAISISERELEIINLVAEGLTTKEIADQLFLSFHTVMTHRRNIMNKLGLNNTAGLIIYAVRQNLLSPNKFLFSQSA